MISLTRLTGAPFALNPDLVERVDCTPDTVITLVDGTKYLVGESLQEVADTILAYRASIVAMASAWTTGDTTERRRSRLTAVPSQPDAEPVQDERTGDAPALHDTDHDGATHFGPRTI
jgi:flagellar protein FlbD